MHEKRAHPNSFTEAMNNALSPNKKRNSVNQSFYTEKGLTTIPETVNEVALNTIWQTKEQIKQKQE